MSFLRDMDLYKAIILLSWLAIPAVGWWALDLSDQVEVGRKAIADATRRGGDLEEIGKYQKAIEEQRKRSLVGEIPSEFEVYFEKRIYEAADGGLSNADFGISRKGDTPALQNRAIDTIIGIDFRRGGREAFPLSRDFLFAVLFNCESQSPMWKLRELSIRNATVGNRRGRNEVPPPELEDKWMVQSMQFASRRPRR